MYKFIFAAMLALGTMLTFPQASAAQDRSAEFNRSRLDRAVRKEILTLPYYGVFDAIGYEINGSTVTLTGYVVRPSTKSDAEDSVADINGLSRVVNNIQVLPLSPSDDRLRSKILQTLMSRGGSLYRYFLGTNPAIRIIVNNGRVSLEGYVGSQGDANLANILTRGVPGSFRVTNNLKVLGRAG